jgi:4-amino-4-deoxy-L-arabinose transferase-like glycosyltransferase
MEQFIIKSTENSNSQIGTSRFKSRRRGILTALLLLLLVVIFFVSRLYKIDQIPGSLYWDEASIGYNAYSVLNSGKDEWGEFLPIHFKAFGEYKLPVYIYSVVASEYFLGLNSVAVRLPAVLFSFGCLLLIFFITQKLTKAKKIALISAFLFLITPWFFIFSRTGYEVTAGMFFFLAGIYFFLLYERSLFFLISSSACFLLALYSYNSFRVLFPFLAVLLFFYLIRKSPHVLKRGWKVILFSLIIFAVGCIPIVNLYRSDDGLKRFSDVGIYQHGDSRAQAVGLFFEHYFRHFNPQFLFLEGDTNLRSHTSGVGELYWLQIIFILFGLWIVIRKPTAERLFIVGLLIISPIPAALTKEVPHSLRAIMMVIPLTMLSAIGIYYLSQRAKYNSIMLGFIIGVFGFMSLVYYWKFLTVYPQLSAQAWQHEYHTIFSQYSERFVQYDHILVSDKYAQPYIFYVFSQRIDPNFFQTQRVLNEQPRIETSVVKNLGTVTFADISFESVPTGRLLIFAHPEEKIEQIPPSETIWNPDKTVAFYVYEYEKK